MHNNAINPGRANASLCSAFARRFWQSLCAHNRMSKESVIGALMVAAAVAGAALVTGWSGVIYLGLSLLVAIVSVHLFARNSVLAKSVAVVFNTDLIYTILMPRNYKKAIRQLDEPNKKQ